MIFFVTGKKKNVISDGCSTVVLEAYGTGLGWISGFTLRLPRDTLLPAPLVMVHIWRNGGPDIRRLWG